MRTTSMAGQSHALINRLVFLAIVLFASLFSGCSRGSNSAENSECSLTHIDVLQAIVENSEIRGYAQQHFGVAEIIFLWERMPSQVQACGVARGDIRIVRSSFPGFERPLSFIAIEKMYFDDDAAFVEIGFPPTGKNGDVFLRKIAGKWVVVEKRLWES